MVRIPTVTVSDIELFHRHLGSGILTGPAIRRGLDVGAIRCSPFEPEQLSQASLDVHLSPHLRVTVPAVSGALEDEVCETYLPMSPLGISYRAADEADDVTEEQETSLITIGRKGLVLFPGVLYLGSTIERLCAPNFAMELAGKSSLARRGLTIHSAGFIEPGFDGNITLELTVTHPLRIYPGWPIGQVTFSTLAGEVESYQQRGHYTGELAAGPVPSQSHRHRPRHLNRESTG